MDVKVYDPSPELQSLVKNYWTLDIPYDPNHTKQRVLPDGCVDMVFMLGDDVLRIVSDDERVAQPRAMVLGQISEPFFVLPTGDVSSFAVSFYPYAFANLTTIPMSALANKETPLAEVLGSEVAKGLSDKVSAADTTIERIGVVEEYLNAATADQRVIESTVSSTVEALLRAKGGASIKDLAQNDNSRRRTLERKFARAVGVSPKQLARVFRLQAALKALLEERAQLTTIAYDSNYYDQSHFIRDFKHFTGTNPKSFLGDEELLLSSVLYGNG